MLRGVVYRLIESFASKGHSSTCSIWKLICGICVCNTLAVGVHLSSTPSISGPGSATDNCQRGVVKCFVYTPFIQEALTVSTLLLLVNKVLLVQVMT